MNENSFSPENTDNYAINELLKERIIGVSGLQKYRERIGEYKNVFFGGESIVIAVDENIVYAFDYFLKLSQERQQVLLSKHRLLNFIFPDHFPEFYKAVGEGVESHGYSYTVRQRVVKADNLEVSREQIKEVYDPIINKLNELGINLYIDTGSTRNFYFGIVDRSNSVSLYYLDRLDVVDLASKWQVNKNLLVDLLELDLQKQSRLDEILRSIEESQNDLDKKGEGFRVEFL